MRVEVEMVKSSFSSAFPPVTDSETVTDMNAIEDNWPQTCPEVPSSTV